MVEVHKERYYIPKEKNAATNHIPDDGGLACTKGEWKCVHLMYIIEHYVSGDLLLDTAQLLFVASTASSNRYFTKCRGEIDHRAPKLQTNIYTYNNVFKSVKPFYIIIY